MPSADVQGSSDDQRRDDFQGRLIARFFLIGLMTFWMLGMVSCPGLYDSKTMAEAWKRHRDNPSEETRRGIEEASASDRRAVLKLEAYAGIGLLALIYLYYRLSKTPPQFRVAARSKHQA